MSDGATSIARRQRRLVLDTLLLGCVGGLSAPLFLAMLHVAERLFLQGLAGYHPPALPTEGGTLVEVVGPHGLWLLPVATTLGGLITGILVYTFAPEAEGHGTDAAVRAFHYAGGVIRARVPVVKMIASAITLGSGGAGGREGPTALISSGVASVYASALHRPEEERRLLMLIGMAAGLAAIFRSPIGTAIFVIEVLYGGMEFEAGALLYTMLASVVAYAVNGLFAGWTPLFHVAPGFVVPPSDYVWYVVLGCAAGLVAALVPQAFYRVRDAFRALPIPPVVKPALGGAAVGLIALRLPQVVGGGYGWIQLAIDGQLSGGLMLALVFTQIAAFSLTISSGGSGGVFAPTLFVGTMLGGFLATIVGVPPEPFAVVGMAAVFGGAARVPIATLLMVTEMTGGYTLLVPAALAVMLSYLVETTVTSRTKYKSLYEAQVPGQAQSPAHAIDYLGIAFRLLAERRLKVPTTVGPLDLRAALAAGIAVDLGEGKRLLLASIESASPLAGSTIQASFPLSESADAEAILVLRGDRARWPTPDTVLQSGDQLMLVASSAAVERLRQATSANRREEEVVRTIERPRE